MLVGKIDVSLQEVERHAHTAEELIAYSDSLVPSEFKHCEAIIGNQRYVCCLILRNSKSWTWQHKKEIMSQVMAVAKIVGYTDSLIEVGTVYGLVNQIKVNKYGGVVT